MYTKALPALLLVLELTSFATAAPYLEKRSFKVERFQNEGYTGRNGPRALAKAYRKYSIPLPDGLVDALEKQDTEMLARRRTKWYSPVAGAAPAVAVEQVSEKKIGDDEEDDDEEEDAGDEQVEEKSIAGDLLGGLLGGGAGKGNPAQGAENGNKPQGAGKDEGAGDNKGGKGEGKGAGGKNPNVNPTPTPSSSPSPSPSPNNGDPNADAMAALARAREGNQTGLVPTIPEPNDVEYLSEVKIGGQPVTLDFDTGSSDLWVFNTQLPGQQTQGRQVYDPTRSNTFKLMPGAEFTIRYGDGSGATGNVGTDVVEIGGAVVPAQAVELATQVTDTFVQDANNGGLVGLAFGSINAVKPQQQKTFFENIMPSLQEPLFTADLRAGKPGAYEFGRIDQSKFTGEMAWIPANTTAGFWQFSTGSFAVGDGPVQPASRPGGQAIADTGTTLLLADPAIVQGYYSQVPGAANDQQAGGVVVPCRAQLPDLHLDIGGAYMARIKGADINFAPVDNTNTTCFGGLQASPQGGLGIYGDILFKSQFVAFNGGNNSLGMANHA
ncbi:eukaryotic aspartyl protease [Cordyceps militaris]|uniref:Eukaryotic aspartyl protease n=1 Tax=Cordyceps militaris TaxID=73501 RepID=A0A2H4SLY8_CORMI|nr:eukaryotic aspartyl protease [Cordyceps militaris]